MLTRENRGAFLAVYIAKVRITVQADGSTILREGHGSWRSGLLPQAKPTTLPSRLPKPTQPSEHFRPSADRSDLSSIARINAALASWSTLRSTAVESPPTQPRYGAHPDDTTPIPRPSHYYGRRHHGSMTDLLRQDQARARECAVATPPLVPAAAELPPTGIDRSQLAIAEPKRLRDKAHLKFVASQPCVICGRQPSDPHHLGLHNSEP